MRVLIGVLAVSLLAACSAKIRQFDGVKGYEIVASEPRLTIRYVEEDKRATWEEMEAMARAVCGMSLLDQKTVQLEVISRTVFEQQVHLSHMIMAESFVAPSGSSAKPASRGATTTNVTMPATYKFKRLEAYCN